MRLLKWIFNLLRTVSLFIVIILLLIIGYFGLHPEKMAPILQTQKMEVNREYPAEEVESEKAEIGVFSMEEKREDIVRNNFRSIKSGQEYFVDRVQSKIKIKARNGYVFLRASQIVSIHSGKPYHELTTIQGKSMEVHHRAYSLKDLYEELSDYSCFFRMKQSVINCQYVEQIEERKGVYKVILENNITVPLPDGQVDRLLSELEGI